MTVTGAGGIGKSRLALRAARRMRNRFCDGIWLVNLAEAPTTGAPEEALLAALGLTAGVGQLPRDVLARRLARGETLLVLDGCEQLTERCAELVAELLRRAPGLRVLVASRRPLDIIGERLLPLGPLRLHPDAVDLFADRASAVLPGFTPATGREAVSEVCRRLDGMPLAIELAAARLRTLSLEQVLHRLDDPLKLLTSNGHSTPDRHRSLSTAIGWSHELCSSGERLLWSRLSVFDGNFDLDAVEYVCSGASLPADEVLAALSGLITQSVVTRDDPPGCTGQARYRMLHPVRAYGARWLAELGETDRLRKRHRDWYLGLATWCELDWFSLRQIEVAQRIAAELPNLRLALEYSLESPDDAHIGQYLTGSLWFYWVGCGQLAEGQRWLDRALALESDQPEPRAKALWVAGLTAAARGESVAALTALHECRELAEGCGDESTAALATQMLGVTALINDDLPGAVALLRECLERYRARGELNALVLLAQVLLAQALALVGDVEAALALAEDARQVAADSGESWVRSYALYALASAHAERGDDQRARELLVSCLEIKQEFGDVLGMTLALERLAPLVVLDAPEWAARLQGAAATGWGELGGEPFRSRHLRDQHERCAARAQGMLGDAGYEAARRDGRCGGLDAAVAQVLERGRGRPASLVGQAGGVAGRPWPQEDRASESRAAEEWAAGAAAALRRKQPAGPPPAKADEEPAD
ncbi:putative ATPase [Streptomyces zagrosensis]|uniref:Putative ATPase n=1 Tax=Streptomyces zagrosensis TaxID=1042984 RepID=A0A7W9UZB1_9ACTN|nr:regulator [Streptomyces zagrosensis]MBB5935609.1 putative ATPase [Streptomyces zagrosensis]